MYFCCPSAIYSSQLTYEPVRHTWIQSDVRILSTLNTCTTETERPPVLLWTMFQNLCPLTASYWLPLSSGVKALRDPYASPDANVVFLTTAVSNCVLQEMETIHTYSNTGRNLPFSRSSTLGEIYNKSDLPPCIVYAVINAKNDFLNVHHSFRKYCI